MRSALRALSSSESSLTPCVFYSPHTLSTSLALYSDSRSLTTVSLLQLEWEDYEDSDEEEEEAGSVGSGSSSPASSTVSFHSAKDEEEQVVLEQKEGEIEHISKGLGLVGLGAA